MDWRIKGVLQKILSVAPGGVRVNDLLQRMAGDMRDFDSHVETRISEDWIPLVRHMGAVGVKPEGLHFMELGTGWLPALPLCFYLAGASRCSTFDIVRHLNNQLTFRMLDLLPNYVDSIAEAGAAANDTVRARFNGLRDTKTLDGLFQRAHIEYYAPAVTSRTSLCDESVDVVFSNNVLEHVSVDMIRDMMRESSRVLRPGGIAIHSINCGDHYAYFDSKITAINYLRYTTPQWEFWTSALNYQNRLRPQDFTSMAEAAGLEVCSCIQKPNEDLLTQLPKLVVAPQFQKYPPDQLCSTFVDFVARKP